MKRKEERGKIINSEWQWNINEWKVGHESWMNEEKERTEKEGQK